MTALQTRLVINGKTVDASDGATLQQVNPATEDTIAQVSSASIQDVNTAVDGAHRLWETHWRDLAPGKRTEILYSISREIRKQAESLARLECSNIGKPISDAREEILLGARVFEFYAGAITQFGGNVIPVARGGLDFTLRQPMGVIASIVPWNFPFPIACWKIAPALAAGNVVVLKPAALSSLTALALGTLALQAGLPDGALQVLSGSGGTLGDALVTHPKIRKVTFTGSTTVGSRIMRLAAGDIKRVSLELGGKSPNIVFADANLERAATSSPMSVFANTGQDCCARSRLFVERSVLTPFVEQFLEATKQLKVGDPTLESTQLGPMVSALQREGVETYLSEARKAGRNILFGGDRPASKGFFLNPAIVLDVEPDDRIWNEEVFGPVVCIRPFDDESSMIREVNASCYGLSGSIWTENISKALRLARKVESGVLSINSHSSVHVEAPFGGFKLSGLGRDLGVSAMEACTELKNIYISD